MRTTLRRLLSTLGAVALVTTFFTASSASAEPTYSLTSLSAEGAVTETTAATIHYTIGGTLPSQMQVRLVEEETGALWTSLAKPPTASGSFTFSWSRLRPAGTYRLRSVFLDGEEWTRDGQVNRGGVSVGTHALDFAPVQFSITGPQTGEMAPPRLTAINLPKLPTAPGKFSTSVTVTDPPRISVRALLKWSNADPAIGDIGSDGAGTIDAWAKSGLHALERIELNDNYGATTKYYRDGRIVTNGYLEAAKHSFDFTALDFTTSPYVPNVDYRAKTRSLPQALRVMWAESEEHLKYVTSWKVTVQPSGRTYNLPVSRTPGQYGDATQLATLTGLQNGVAHTVSIAAVGPTGTSPASAMPQGTPSMSGNIVSLIRNGQSRSPIFAAGQTEAKWQGDENAQVVGYAVGQGRFVSRIELGPTKLRIGSGGDLNRHGRTTYLGIDEFGQLFSRSVGDNYVQVIGRGWGSMRWVDGGADFTGDRFTDVIAVDPSGNLKVYPTKEPGVFGAPRTIGVGWGGFRTVFTPGDFDGDRKADVMAVDSAGALWLYRGNGVGGWLGKVNIGSGWNGFGAVNAARDFTGDGFEDVLAVRMDGVLKVYPGNGRGGWLAARTVGSGWHTFF